MFHNKETWQYIHNKNSEMSKTKIHQHHKDSRKKLSKSKNYIKSPKKSKLKHINVVSDYVGQDRLTKHVGFFTKGKISDSISRVEKLMPQEVKARAKQDLKQVLKLTSNLKYKHRRKHHKSNGDVFKKKSIQNFDITPHYLSYKTGFASCSWKDKLTKSVGLSTVNNSVLSSVHEPSKTALHVQEELLIARKTLVTKIHSCIKKVNYILFPGISNKDKVKRTLLEIKNQFVLSVSSEKTSLCSDICESVENSLKSDVEHSQNTVNEDFQLNPIFTGDSMDHRDISEIFPSVSESVNDNGDITDNSPCVLNGYCDEINNSPSTSVFRKESNFLNFMPSSPTTSNDSPAWKLQVSPIKFKPDLIPSPTIYFRHKMF